MERVCHGWAMGGAGFLRACLAGSWGSDAMVMGENDVKAIDDLLQGTKYAGATEGKWQNNYDPNDEDQLDCDVGVPIHGWGWTHHVTEMSVNGFPDKDKRLFANLALVTDAKRNAALAQLVGPLVEALDEANRMSQEEAYTKYQVASLTAKALTKARDAMKIVEES